MAELLAHSVFYEIAALLVLASVIGLIGLLLRQPLIVSFIAVGILAGPSVLEITQAGDHIDLLAELGIAVLLFLVGLKLDLKLIRTLGPVALATGLGQVFFTAAIGYFIGLALGFNWLTSLYIAVALTFSSTIIIVKLLSDKKEIGSLHGRIALGFLIVQDLVVVIAMAVLSAVGGTAAKGMPSTSLISLGATALVAAGFIAVFVRYLANPLVERLARVPELLSAFAIGWAVLLAAASDYLGFSKELGGLIAGVSLASTHFREVIAARLSSLRDFLLLFFFIALGAQLDLSILGQQVYPAFIFSLFVLIGNPLIVLAIMGYMGYRKRTGFLAGLTVAQISEFSLIFMAMGITLGHVNNEALGLVTLVGLITITLSTYMILYSHPLYTLFEPLLKGFERKHPYREETNNVIDKDEVFDVLLVGLGNYGSSIAERFMAQGLKILAVDFNSNVVRQWRNRGLPTIYGDITDPDFMESLPLPDIPWVISALPNYDARSPHSDPRKMMINLLEQGHFQGKIAVSANDDEDAETLLSVGADLIFRPFQDAADKAFELMYGEYIHEEPQLT